MKHLVSVVSPAFNSRKHVQRLVECVSEQTTGALEHIIVDDGSTDDTLDRLRSLELEYPHVKVVTQQNQGAGIARNRGISLARGKYISFLDSDDQWAADKLAAQIDFMEEEGVAFSYGDYFEVDGDSGTVINERHAPEELTHKDLLSSCPIGCLTAAYNQQELGKQYMPAVRRGQDWALWLSITKLGVVARRYPGTKASYTIEKHSLSRKKFRKMIDMLKIYRMQGLGIARSLYHLALHSVHRLRK